MAPFACHSKNGGGSRGRRRCRGRPHGAAARRTSRCRRRGRRGHRPGNRHARPRPSARSETGSASRHRPVRLGPFDGSAPRACASAPTSETPLRVDTHRGRYARWGPRQRDTHRSNMSDGCGHPAPLWHALVRDEGYSAGGSGDLRDRERGALGLGHDGLLHRRARDLVRGHDHVPPSRPARSKSTSSSSVQKSTAQCGGAPAGVSSPIGVIVATTSRGTGCCGSRPRSRRAATAPPRRRRARSSRGNSGSSSPGGDQRRS